MNEFRYDRVPRWIIAIGAIGTPVAGLASGPLAAVGFVLGTAGSWWNYRYLVNVVQSLSAAAVSGKSPPTARIVLGLFSRFALLAAGAIAILKASKVSLIALLAGLFASCIAIGVEISYERIWGKSTNSG